MQVKKLVSRINLWISKSKKKKKNLWISKLLHFVFCLNEVGILYKSCTTNITHKFFIKMLPKFF